jgi:hypothetical protein
MNKIPSKAQIEEAKKAGYSVRMIGGNLIYKRIEVEGKARQ